MNIRNILLTFFIFSIFSCEHNEDLDEEQYMTLIKDKLDCMNMPRPEGSYNYPVLPGMEKWKSFTTTQEMIDACQIPATILERQTTQAVFQGIWEYPFFFEITSRHNHYQQDFETIYANTNVYKEFITRKDAGQCLYSRLLLVNPISPTTIYSRGLELFTSQSILNFNTMKKNLLLMLILCYAFMGYSQSGLLRKETDNKGMVTFAELRTDSAPQIMSDSKQLLKQIGWDILIITFVENNL